jgi:hypothetical protein
MGYGISLRETPLSIRSNFATKEFALSALHHSGIAFLKKRTRQTKDIP